MVGAGAEGVVAVVGDAVVDLLLQPDGRIGAALGGGPFNAARTCGRLGVAVAFVGCLSNDRFGGDLRARLVDDGVDVTGVYSTESPTTLAAAELDDDGSATYRFYVDGTSAPELDRVELPPATRLVLTGGLALVLEPMAAAVAAALAATDPATLVMVDVNCRPAAIGDRDAYLDRLTGVLARADVVKVSDEDLAFVRPGQPAVDAARDLLAGSTAGRPKAILLTAGGAAVTVLTADGERSVDVAPVDVVDTIGAGDAFAGGLIAWWWRSRLGAEALAEADTVARAAAAGVAVAAVVCGRRGADPPWRHELPADWAPS